MNQTNVYSSNISDSKDVLNDAQETYNSIKRLKRVYEDLIESFELQLKSKSKGQPLHNFYKEELEEKESN